jgi:hypothetical protein
MHSFESILKQKDMKTILIISVMVVGFMTSCGIYDHVYSSFDRTVDFNNYQTFAWLPDSSVKESNEFSNSAYDNDIIRNNVKNYINHSLTKKGYQVSTDEPDLLVQLILLNERREKVIIYHTYPPRHYYFHNHFYYPYYYPYYRFYTWYGWSYPPFWYDEVTGETRTYVKGTITVNMYDREQKKLVWTGSAEGDIYDPAYIEFDVHPAINRIMDLFPSRSKPKHYNEMDHNRVVRALPALPLRDSMSRHSLSARKIK